MGDIENFSSFVLITFYIFSIYNSVMNIRLLPTVILDEKFRVFNPSLSTIYKPLAVFLIKKNANRQI